jgi:hypothetical protein
MLTFFPSEMMKRVKEAVKKDNIFQAKHIVGEYFIALNRRFLSLLFHADEKGERISQFRLFLVGTNC